ncbi:MAG: cell division protein SepF [Clostridiales bacterium]|jgi:cell division inhibitor SepF|nr:cell division protein SepF [Clostridiales bacterium]MBR5938203.1 cell division protein SepF [Clostridiales bacterium]
MAGFWNSLVNKIAGVDNDYYEGDEEGYQDYEEENFEDIHEIDGDYSSPEQEPLPMPEMNSRIVPIKSVSAADTQVVILQPDSIRSSQQVCDHIRAGHTVICNIENVERAVAQRVIDYISGAAYSIDGNVKPIDQNRKTFVVAPRTVALMDRETLAKQEEAQNQAIAYRQVL